MDPAKIKENFEDIVKQFQTPLVNFLYGYVRNEATALDLAQEVFIKVYHQLSKYDGRAAFSTWLFTIASNHAKDFLRKKRLPESSLEESHDIMVDSHNLTPDRAAAESEIEAIVDQALETIPLEYREPMVLRHMAHRSIDEIAQILQIPSGTVKIRLFRGRRMLQAILDKKLQKNQ